MYEFNFTLKKFLNLIFIIQTCGEIIFGRYDADRDVDYIRYPVVIRLDNYRLTIQLPTKAKEEEKKDKEVRFVGHREYFLNGNFINK